MHPEKVLPPGVNGKVSGHLIVNVDEVFWTRNSPGEVFVELLWWGEKDSTIFRPEDITNKNSASSKDTSVTYTIRTSPGLFESYLRNCGKLTFTILRGQNKNVVIGSTVVKDMEKIISEKNYHSYFPIFSPKGLRLGDIHICFEIHFKLKQSHFNVNHVEEANLLKPGNFRKTIPTISQQQLSKSSTATSQEVLSDIIQKGHELRKAMVMSVLADCPVEDIESVVNSNSNKSPKKDISKMREAKLVDFLLGKDMTPDEESKAMETLRCTSLDENLMSIAETSSLKPKVTKTTCCLHGKKCYKKKNSRPVKVAPASTSADTCNNPTSSSSVQPVNEVSDMPPEEKKADTPAMSYNCYELFVKTLHLTPEGCKKIHYAPVLKDSENPISNMNPPGTSFILEISRPRKDQWTKTSKFTTKQFKENFVQFSQGTTHKLCGTVTWARVKTHVEGLLFTVYWRHLNQRLPCPLGSGRLEALGVTDSDEMSLTLPMYSNTRLLTGHLNIRVRLGHTSMKGGEALYKIKESIEETPDIPKNEAISGTKDEKANQIINPQPVIVSSDASAPASSVSSDNGNDVQYTPSSLDEELVRTINLLNSKSDGKFNSEAKSTPSTQVVNKQEACVQTTLPIDPPICSSCGCPTNHRKAVEREISVQQTNLRTEQQTNIPSNSSDKYVHQKLIKHPSGLGTVLNDAQDDHIMHEHSSKSKDVYHSDLKLTENSNFMPLEVNGTEKIHEFTVKIEKVVGVPLFNGDCDLDCYVDYAFPKVNSSGKLMFDDPVDGTEVKIALKETEFKTVLRHRLRLGFKLTRSLLSLPTNAITFRLWGRFYGPRPQDFKLGKATLPLSKLSAMELKYEQHSKRQPVVERYILPISVLESPMTSGYKGPFGEMHLTIVYSNASGLSYREWRCKTKDDHYWCRSQLLKSNSNGQNPMPSSVGFDCPKANAEFLEMKNCKNKYISSFNDNHKQERPPYNSDINYERQRIYEPSCSHSGFTKVSSRLPETFNRFDINTNKFVPQDSHKFNSMYDSRLHNYHNNYDTNFVLSGTKIIHPDFKASGHIDEAIIQTNLKGNIHSNGYSSEFPKTYEVSADLPSRLEMDGIHTRAENDSKQRLQPVGESGRKQAESHSAREFCDNAELLVSGRRENIVEKVLKDINERKRLEKKKATYTIQNNRKDDIRHLKTNSDAFDSFDLRVDLPAHTHADSSDFEVNSQYSFLETPPPVGSTFPNNSCNDFESSSSNSVKQRILDERSFNPFTSQSCMSLTLNSESSIFKPSDKRKPVKSDHHHSENKKSCTEEHDKSSLQPNSGSNSCEPSETKLTNTGKSRSLKNNDNEANNVSSDETLKSVESLKSFRGDCLQRQSRDIGIETEVGVENKDTQTSHKENEYFKARVAISKALGLPSLEVKQSNGKIELMMPTSYAYFSAYVNGQETVLKTPVVEKKCNPVWNSSWDVFLPIDLLMKSDRELEIFVDLSGDCDESWTRASDVSTHWPIVLRTGVDLTSVTAGLENACGWFSLSDRALLSRAQIKVAVSPLEDISRFRQQWLKEYTKSKGKKMKFSVPQQSSSIATSLQQKLAELEHLTKRMKQKMENRSKWDQSPPLSLLAEVHEMSLGPSIEDVDRHLANLRQGQKNNNTAETATSPIVLPGDVQQDVPEIVISDDDCDKGSCDIKTYTVCESSSEEDKSSHQDSLETPSQTIDRILNRAREPR